MIHYDRQLFERILSAAVDRALEGKGLERHGERSVPFERQPMQVITDLLGSADGLRYQIIKKTVESRRLTYIDARNEMLDVIVYAVGVVLALERGEKAKELGAVVETLHPKTPAPSKASS